MQFDTFRVCLIVFGTLFIQLKQFYVVRWLAAINDVDAQMISLVQENVTHEIIPLVDVSMNAKRRLLVRYAQTVLHE